MRKKICVIVLASMLASILFTGCGANENIADDVTDKTTQVIDSGIEQTTKREMITTEQDELYSTSNDETTSNVEEATTNKVVEEETSMVTTTTEKVVSSEKKETVVSKEEVTTSKKEETTSNNKELQIVRNIINQIITDDMTELQKAKAIHDYMVMNLDYDYESFESGKYSKSCYTVEGVLTGKYAICEGYAKTFKALCDAAGIECEFVSGTATGVGGTGGHAWNQVKIDGKWYNVDVTWDDSEGDSFDDHTNNNYEYFLISDEMMYKTHSTKNAKHICTDSLYFEVLKLGTAWSGAVYVETEDEFEKLVIEKVNENATYIEFYIKNDFLQTDEHGDKRSMKKMVDEIIKSCNVLDDYDITCYRWCTDQFGVNQYRVEIALKDGEYTKIEPFSTIDDVKVEILRLSKDYIENKEYKLYVDKEFAETKIIYDGTIQRWASDELGIEVVVSGEGSFSDTVHIYMVRLRRDAKNDY